MRKIKEILRLKLLHGLSNRKIAKNCSTSHSVIGESLSRAEKAGLTWRVIEALDDTVIEAKLFPPSQGKGELGRQMPNMEYLYRELTRNGVTLQLLWHENIGDPTIADAILDRLVHNAHRFNLHGKSMRKRKTSLTKKENSET